MYVTEYKSESLIYITVLNMKSFIQIIIQLLTFVEMDMKCNSKEHFKLTSEKRYERCAVQKYVMFTEKNVRDCFIILISLFPSKRLPFL